MPYLLPNQQCQSTGVNYSLKKKLKTNMTADKSADLFADPISDFLNLFIKLEDVFGLFQTLATVTTVLVSRGRITAVPL